MDLDIYFRLFITNNAENSACQDDQVAAIFDFVTIGLVVVLCVTPRSVCLATQRSICVVHVVQLANRKGHVEVQWNTDGDTPAICVAALI